MSAVDVKTVMAGLKGFQKDAVNHVIDRFYGGSTTESSRRFLIADETGLGKSVIARGIIARTIEHLRNVDSVRRIDIVYVCSNSDLARQNLQRLNVTGNPAIGMATRLSMLAKDSRRLESETSDGGKKVNLVSFTPGTSFREGGWRQGSADERAMLTIILDRLVNRSHSDRRTTRLLMRGTVSSHQRFDTRYVRPLRAELRGEPDPRIVRSFERAIRVDGTLDEYLALRDAARGRHDLDASLRERTAGVTDRLRRHLAAAGVDTLEPDLVILDEFQRFRHLLADPETGGPAAELAHSLFNHPDARVLLLSATPYKPFTNSDDEEDHYRDFLATVSFLSGRDDVRVDAVERALTAYRGALVNEGDVVAAAARVRNALVPFMTRSERPVLPGGDDMLATEWLDGGVPTADELGDWVALRRLGEVVGAPVDLEYWKSIPHFATFMDGYQVAQKMKESPPGPVDGAPATALGGVRGIERRDIERFEKVDFANGYLRALVARTLDRGWWRMLWLPPTLPYLQPGGVYEDLPMEETTKHVIFSAWSGVPTAVASLLSYEVDRRIAGSGDLLGENTADGRAGVRLRLQYQLGADGRPRAMSTLALFWPHPGLAAVGDPLAAARLFGRRVSSSELLSGLDDDLGGAGDGGPAWAAFFSAPGAVPAALTAPVVRALLTERMPDDRTGEETGSALVSHVESAFERIRSPIEPRHPMLPALAAHSPGCIAYRALLSTAGPEATTAGTWRAAWVLSTGIRALFNRRETIAMLVALAEHDKPYWQVVLDYCADGNLQSVLDEYLFQLRSERGGAPLDDGGLLAVASAAAAAMGMRPARYIGHETHLGRRPIPFQARFAVRYGGRGDTDSGEPDAARQAEVRAAFNSPFAPFILASTSVGQEGIDFHWWSHSVIHWNLPSNPVDFEQREGRVNRYAGHAIRKNVAIAHWQDVLRSDSVSPWDAAFAAATKAGAESSVGPSLGDFAPWWVYPGPARIHRTIATFPLSRDLARYARLRDALTLYRLTLGQPRQEDMVELMRQRGIDSRDVPAIDLRPPSD